jgi:DNA replication ATP-dependent helicase Dna2
MRQIGDLLKDWRRINVSFTRAKAKLVIFGSRSTLKGDKLLDEFLQLMESKRWIYTLPRRAVAFHACDTAGPIKVEEKDEPAVTMGNKREGKRGGGVLASRYFAKDVLAVRIGSFLPLMSTLLI